MEPELVTLFDSLAALGPAGTVGGFWIFTLLRHRAAMQERINELEDRLYNMATANTEIMSRFATLVQAEQDHHHA